ncbi:CbtA family protein [Halomonadaceae bacterium KBTZ08]
MFRSFILSACLIGAVAGVLLTAIQSFGVTPILLSAEQFEGAAAQPEAADAHGHDHDHGGHAHGGDGWAPSDGGERLFFTGLSNVLAGVGFTAVMLVLMNQLHERGRLRLTPLHGLLLGLIGYLVVFVAPSLGLPPEVPGANSAALATRQLWWVTTVILAATGLGLLCLASGWKRALGLPLLGLPYLFVPAHPEGPLFSHPDPEAVSTLHALHHDFIWATGLTNLAFWLVVGLACALVLRRIAGNRSNDPEDAAA